MATLSPSPDGLRTFGKLIQKFKQDNNWSLREVAQSLEISSASTVKSWIGNIDATDDEIHKPSYNNIIFAASKLLNPKTGMVFSKNDLLSVCQGQLKLSDDEISQYSFRLDGDGQPNPVVRTASTATGYVPNSLQAQQISPHYVEMATHYWYTTIEPGVALMLENAGEQATDGVLSLTSRDYTYEKFPEGHIQVTPHDDRPPLTPGTMTNQDWQVMKAIAQRAYQKYNQQSQRTPSPQPQRKGPSA